MPDGTELQVPTPQPTPLSLRLSCLDGFPTQPSTNQLASLLPASWASTGSSHPRIPCSSRAVGGKHVSQRVEGLHTSSMRTCPGLVHPRCCTPRRGCCDPGTPGTLTGHWLHRQAPECCVPLCSCRMGLVLPQPWQLARQSLIQHLSLARGVPMCTQDSGQA